jgi:hypothetical protein
MLDKVIHKHLDEMDAIHADIEKDIDALMKEIDVKAIMSDPENALLAIIGIVQNEISVPYIERAVNAGKKLAKAIEKDGEIVVEDTNDPKRNAE